MATSVVMPALEMAQETGKLVAWRKQEGEAVRKGELLMEVETDKAVVEIEAEADGILGGVRAKEGDVVAVGQTIAWILAPGEQVPAEQQPSRTGRETVHRQPASAPPPPAPTADRGERQLMSPKARRLMAETGARATRGSGPGGAILATDLEAAASAAPAKGLATLPTVWQIMAERMAASWAAVPHFYVSRDIDAGALLQLRSNLNTAESGRDITITDLLVFHVARVLKRHPRLNASWVELDTVQGTIQTHTAVNIGIATGIEHGVVVPVIQDADRLTLAEIAGRRRELVERARAGRSRPADLAGGTFTISNLGMFKIDAFTAIVNDPQGAILAVGRIADRVVARDGSPVVRPMMSVTLSSDHRVIDGVRAAAFLADVADSVEQAERSLS
ncbi:MAG TPA: dihydrolipoamide acetyltransferase family protein [Vicinamibacterales bacterium]|nr:dihydrolipoamide acetyltransferase family protein [Vicinamibacterales bacterium]